MWYRKERHCGYPRRTAQAPSALFKVLFDRQGLPADFIFLRADTTFAKVLAMSPASLVGQKVSAIDAETSWPIDLMKALQDIVGRYWQPGGLSSATSKSLYLEQKRSYHITGYLAGIDSLSVYLRALPQLGGRSKISCRKVKRDQSPDIYQVCVEYAPLAIFFIDSQGEIVDVNPRFCALTGYQKVEIRGRNIITLLAQKNGAPDKQLVISLLKKGLLTGCWPIYNKSETLIWLQVSGVTLRDDLYVIYARSAYRLKDKKSILQLQFKLEDLVGKVSAKLVTLPVAAADTAIDYALAEVGECLELDRSAIFLYTEDKKIIYKTHSWTSSAFSDSTINHRLLVDTRPWWHQRLSALRPFQLTKIAEVPVEASREKQDLQKEGVKSLICIPLFFEGQLRGYWRLDALREERSWPKGQLRLLQLLAEVIMGAIERKEIEIKLKYFSMHDQLTGLYNRMFFEEVLRRVGKSRDYPVTLVIADVDGLKLVNDTLGHSAGDELLQGSAQVLEASLRQGDILARLGGDEFGAILTDTSGKEAAAIKNRIHANLQEYNQRHMTRAPLSISVGVATAEGATSLSETMKKADEQMYLEKMRYSAAIRETIIQKLLYILKERDYADEGHTQRVAELVLVLGRRTDLSERQLNHLSLLAEVHDLGKVGLPDVLVFKKGALTEEEWLQMRQHSEIGYRIARSAPKLAEIADFILKHHECWDGSGYPLQLSGQDIPIECRIFAIVDAFDAMTSQRPYRQTKSRAEALQELQREAGKCFDPYLVQEFIAMMRERV